MANADVVSFVAVGDVRPKLQHPHEAFDLIRPTLQGADITFGQVECALSEHGVERFSETVYNEPARTPIARAMPTKPEDPRGALVLADAGFDVVSLASNHAMRWGAEGLAGTMESLTNAGITPIGAGQDIHEAIRPAIFERKGTKIGILAYCSVVPRGDWATLTRAGVAPVRASTAYHQFDWQPGSVPEIISAANPDDLAGMVDDITRLRSEVDVLIVSHHWGLHFTPAAIAMYEYEIAHASVDAGADLVLGHHQHILKGVEVYRGKVIFHGLANCSMNPMHFSEEPDYNGRMARYGHRRYVSHLGHRMEADPGYPDEGMQRDAQKSIIVKADIAGGRIERVAFQPMWINPVTEMGRPEPLRRDDSRSEQVYDYMEWICGDQNLPTTFVWDGDDVVVVP